MPVNKRGVFPLALFGYLFASSAAFADGGSARAYERVGNYQIAVFTSPWPFRAGPVDISVLVQDATTGECMPAARVTIRLTSRNSGQVLEYPATKELASNKLFHAAVFDLPLSGWWDVDVAVEGVHGFASIRLAVEAGEPQPRWLTLWPWFCWPVLVVVLFGIHQVLVRRKFSERPRPRSIASVSRAPHPRWS